MQLLPLLEDKQDRSYLDTCLDHYKNARKGLDDLAVGEPGRTPIHPQYVAKVLDELAADDAVFTCDVGTPTIWAARYLHMNGKRRLLGSFTHGSMANALPQAIGAQAAFPGRQVISLSGDGGLAMLLGDLLTLRQLKLPVKMVVFNNSTLGFVELEMKAAGLLDFATDLVNPELRPAGRVGQHSGAAGGKAGGSAPALAEGAGPRRPRAGGGHREPPGAVHAADHHRRAGQGLQPLHGARGAQRQGRRGDRSGKDQSLPLGSGLRLDWMPVERTAGPSTSVGMTTLF